MEIVKNSNGATNNSSSNQNQVSGNIYWSYNKETKTGKLLFKNNSNEILEVNNLNLKLSSMYLFLKEKDKLSMSLLCYDLDSLVNSQNELYFVSLPSFYFIEFYNNNPVKFQIKNESGKLQLKFLEVVDKKQKISDDERKYFNILNYLANSDNSDLCFKIKVFIK